MAPVADTTNRKPVQKAKPAQPKPSIAYNQVDNTFRLTTPENISFEYQLAGPFRRLLPYCLDVVFVIACYAALMITIWLMILAISALMAFLGISGVAEFFFAIGLAIGPIGFFIAYWFYGAYFETYYNGRTCGKMIVGLRVLSTDGHAIDGVQAMLRNLFRLIDIMPIITLPSLLENNDLPPIIAAIPLPTAIFGLIVMSVSPKFQRLGDLVAGTMVVNKEAKLNPHVQTFSDTRVPQLAELIPSSFYVSNSLSKAIAAYVERREQLGVARAGEIATKLAGTLADRFGLPVDTDPDLLICSLYYKIFVGESKAEPVSSIPPSRYERPVGSVSVVTDGAIQESAPALPVAPIINTSTNLEPE